ncbi:bifunctional diguanylate cyclase/phosphodiesterase [Cognatilysobacter terrigena]|uniref:bifunctional diguanylate cyclase/phosphodiesterase n=1 Tax=Cognatilysobacter terrigena TaxID=2488749 RepID=UPI00105C2529|nr:EAL domain-containing protein [Lysobacter terrigena]
MRRARRRELVAALEAGLPVEANVAAGWREREGVTVCATEDADDTLTNAVRNALLGATPIDAHDCLIETWPRPGGRHGAVAARLQAALDPDVRLTWSEMARALLATHLDADRVQRRADSLEKSERLQQALYEIADLAGSGLELSAMLRMIHHVIGGLMYAANFYIVLYDDVRDTLRFVYFADERDDYVAEPDRDIPTAELPNSLTVALLRHGEPVRGPSDAVRGQLNVVRDAAHGPDSEDWLGVPMRRDDRVCGAIVVQSYDRAGVYGEEERALLAFVAQHILTALERHLAREELEHRVRERTHALERLNAEMQTEIEERQRAEQLQSALFRIAELSMSAPSLDDFYREVHAIVGELLYARNFYIAMISEDGERLEFPYSIDERDGRRKSRPLGFGLTEYVLTRRKPLLVERADIEKLTQDGELISRGALACCWLGVPLWRDDQVVGVIAVQSYSQQITFSRRDQELLMFVAHHIGIGLERKRSQEALMLAHAELEERVDARTRELARANRELVAQIGERLRAEQRLTHQARHDSLTGLPNRTHLVDCLTESIEMTQTHPHKLFAVLYLDLDRFKLVNDSAGHSAGDELLMEAARRIAACVRPGDVVARLGGDEFAVLVHELDGVASVERLAGRILETLGQPWWVAGREVFPSASVGIALWHPRYRSGSELLRDADAAMYRAKAAGRGRWATFDEAMREEAMRILDLEADLRRAINGDGFVAFYQPIVRLADRSIVGHEALLRWSHASSGLLTPASFVNVGENSSLIEEVDWLVYAQVADRIAHTEGGYISVNVSPRHFRDSAFADRLLRMLDKAKADPRRLRIEITEVALLEEAPRVMNMLNHLRGHGVLAQLDDFGTGFSALSYLHRFPIECLKIDQSFIAGLGSETRVESEAVVRAIQALAGSLGIHTVAEGIENLHQQRLVRELGCTLGQGYLYGRPMPELVSGIDAVASLVG